MILITVLREIVLDLMVCFEKSTFYLFLLFLSSTKDMFFIIIILENKEGRERDKRKQCHRKYQSVASRACPTKDLTPWPGSTLILNVSFRTEY